jgi:hypothetical protein
MKEKHPIDYEDLQTWEEAFREPEHEVVVNENFNNLFQKE